MVEVEFPYTLTTDSAGAEEVIDAGATTIFSVGSGRLRTVSAGAGMSLASFAAGSTAAAVRRRHHQKAPIARVKKAREPTTAPATTPPPILWPEVDVDGLSTQLNVLHRSQLLEVPVRRKERRGRKCDTYCAI
jgi:hypothetical protein